MRPHPRPWSSPTRARARTRGQATRRCLALTKKRPGLPAFGNSVSGTGGSGEGGQGEDHMPPEAQTGGGAGPPRGPGASGRHAALCPQPPAGPNARPWLSQAKDSRQKPDLPRARASLDPSTTGPSKLPSLRTRSCGLPHDWVRPGPCPPRVPRDGENEAVGPLAKAGPRTGSELAQPVQAQPFQPPTRCLCMSQRHRGRGRAQQPGQGLGPGGACFRRARRRCQRGGQEGTASSWPHRGAAPTGAGRGAGGAVGLVTAWSLCPEDRRPSEVAAAAGWLTFQISHSL